MPTHCCARHCSCVMAVAADVASTAVAVGACLDLSIWWIVQDPLPPGATLHRLDPYSSCTVAAEELQRLWGPEAESRGEEESDVNTLLDLLSGGGARGGGRPVRFRARVGSGRDEAGGLGGWSEAVEGGAFGAAISGGWKAGNGRGRKGWCSWALADSQSVMSSPAQGFVASSRFVIDQHRFGACSASLVPLCQHCASCSHEAGAN